MRLNRNFRHFDGTFLVPLVRLKKGLTSISDCAHQWAVRVVPNCLIEADYSSYVFALIGYSNPDLDRTPNMICFAVPLVELAGNIVGRPVWLACIAKSWLIPVSTSRQWDGNCFRPSVEGDFQKFWSVLATQFCGDLSYHDASLFEALKSREMPNRLIDGRSYKKALADHLEQIASKRGVIDDAVRKVKPHIPDPFVRDAAAESYRNEFEEISGRETWI